MGKESSIGQELVRFLKYATNADIAATASLDINLQQARSEYGNNFNTLIVLNTSPINVKVTLDGYDVTVVNGNNGSFTFDWKDGIIYNSLQLTNINGATATGASSIFITYGRTGQQ